MNKYLSEQNERPLPHTVPYNPSESLDLYFKSKIIKTLEEDPEDYLRVSNYYWKRANWGW